MIATDISKQQELDSNPKALEQINVTGNLEQQATLFFITEEAKFFARNCKSILILFFASM